MRLDVACFRYRSTGDDRSLVNVSSGDVLPPLPNSPFAKWRGQIDLGGDPIDCYVLDTEQRVIALRSAIKAVAGSDSGNLGSYISATSLKPFINSDLILGELVEFAIPGTQFRGNGMTMSSSLRFLIAEPHSGTSENVSTFAGFRSRVGGMI